MDEQLKEIKRLRGVVRDDRETIEGLEKKVIELEEKLKDREAALQAFDLTVVSLRALVDSQANELRSLKGESC